MVLFLYFLVKFCSFFKTKSVKNDFKLIYVIIKSPFSQDDLRLAIQMEPFLIPCVLLQTLFSYICILQTLTQFFSK